MNHTFTIKTDSTTNLIFLYLILKKMLVKIYVLNQELLIIFEVNLKYIMCQLQL